MLKDNYRLKNNEVVTIIPVGDVHIGSSQFNEEFFEYWESIVSKIKKNRRIYLMGDLLESASKTVGNSAFSTNMSVNDQKEYLIDILSPLKKDIVVYVIGNHENRISNEFNFDMVGDIARELGIESGHQYFDSFQINGEIFDVIEKLEARYKISLGYINQSVDNYIRKELNIPEDDFSGGEEKSYLTILVV